MARQDESSEMVIRQYERLRTVMDQDTARLRQELGRTPCPMTCYGCCRNTATLLMSRIEILDIERGLECLPREVQQTVYLKAMRAIQRIEQMGYRRGNGQQLSTGMIEAIRGTKDAECPMLIGGVCAIYEHRPVICRLWGYPMTTNGSITCCRKTFIGKRDLFRPTDYDHYWQATHELSAALGSVERVPSCYAVVDILDGLEPADE